MTDLAVVPVELESAIAAAAGHSVAAAAAKVSAIAAAATAVAKALEATDQAGIARAQARAALEATEGVSDTRAAAEAALAAAEAALENATAALTAATAAVTTSAANATQTTNDRMAAAASAATAAAAVLGIVPDNSIASDKLQDAAVTLEKIANSVYGVGSNRLLQLNPAGGIPAVDGSQITGLTTAQLSGARWPTGYMAGLTLSYTSTTTFTVAAGDCRNEDGGSAFDMSLGAAMTKSLAAFAAGADNGALDTGAIAATSWYHVHLIRKTSDGSLDVLLSLSPTAPTMPAGYVARRRLGSVRTNVSSQLAQWTQFGDEFLWFAAVVDFDVANPGTAAVLRTLSVPTGLKVWAISETAIFSGTTNNDTAWISSPDTSDQAPLASGITTPLNAPISSASAPSAPAWLMSERRIRTNTSAQVRTRLSSSSSNDRIGCITRGWIDNRGKL